MKLPLLLGVAAIALSGCNDNCDLDYCSSTSQASSTSYQAQASAPTYQAPSRRTSSPVNLSGYGGMYSEVRLPDDNQSRETEPPIDNQATSTSYQAPASAPKPAGFITPPIVSGKCQTDGAAEYNPNTNTIHLCRDMPPSQRRYAIAHEMGHAVDWQKDRTFEPDLEYWADQYAVNRLLQEGDCEAVESRAVKPTDAQNDYTKGILYAREMHSIHCR